MVPKICYKKLKERLVVLDGCREHRRQRKGVVTSSVHLISENLIFSNFASLVSFIHASVVVFLFEGILYISSTILSSCEVLGSKSPWSAITG